MNQTNIGMAIAPYRWVITKDLLNVNNSNNPHPRVYVTGPSGADDNLISNPSAFTMYDDDEICYYEGLIFGDYDGFEPLDDYGTPNSGCTAIKINGEWL